jgi:hypothetical protein
MFLSKAEPTPLKFLSNAPLKGKPIGLTHKDLTRLERLARDKHCSLLQKFANYGQKSLKHWPPDYKTITDL